MKGGGQIRIESPENLLHPHTLGDTAVTMLPSVPPMPYVVSHGHTILPVGSGESVAGSWLCCLQDWQPTGKERTARTEWEKTINKGNGNIRELTLCA